MAERGGGAVGASAGKPRFTTVLWDCDGTLLDTLADLAAAGNAICHAHGWPTFSEDAYRRKIGDGQRMLARRILPEALTTDDALAEQAYREFSAYYGAHRDDRTAPYPGIPEALRALGAAGVRMGVLTNKNQEFAEALVARWFGDELACVQGRTDDMPAKPEPPMTRALMGRLGADPARTLLVGDMPVDVACARNAGLAVCGAAWGFRGRAELETAGADWVADHPGQVVELVLGDRAG